MEFELHMSSLEENKGSFESKLNTTELVNACNSINPEGQLASTKQKINDLVKDITESYDKYKSWVNDYVDKLNTTEGDLSKFDSPELKGDFSNIFTKVLAPALKTGGTNEALENLSKLGVMNNSTNKAIDWAVGIANNNNYGYSQNTRWGNPNYDCSSLVISAWEAAGVPVQSQYGATYTGDMRQAFLASGQFEWIPGPVDSNNLQPGDVLLNESSHTEMYIGNGQNVGAHANRDGVDGDSSGTEINVQAYWDDNWDGVLRYKG